MYTGKCAGCGATRTSKKFRSRRSGYQIPSDNVLELPYLSEVNNRICAACWRKNSKRATKVQKRETVSEERAKEPKKRKKEGESGVVVDLAEGHVPMDLEESDESGAVDRNESKESKYRSDLSNATVSNEQCKVYGQRLASDLKYRTTLLCCGVCSEQRISQRDDSDPKVDVEDWFDCVEEIDDSSVPLLPEEQRSKQYRSICKKMWNGVVSCLSLSACCVCGKLTRMKQLKSLPALPGSFFFEVEQQPFAVPPIPINGKLLKLFECGLERDLQGQVVGYIVCSDCKTKLGKKVSDEPHPQLPVDALYDYGSGPPALRGLSDMEDSVISWSFCKGWVGKAAVYDEQRAYKGYFVVVKQDPLRNVDGLMRAKAGVVRWGDLTKKNMWYRARKPEVLESFLWLCENHKEYSVLGVTEEMKEEWKALSLLDEFDDEIENVLDAISAFSEGDILTVLRSDEGFTVPERHVLWQISAKCFPYGNVTSWNRNPRLWGRHMMLYHDGRFAQHKVLPFLIHQLVGRKELQRRAYYSPVFTEKFCNLGKLYDAIGSGQHGSDDQKKLVKDYFHYVKGAGSKSPFHMYSKVEDRRQANALVDQYGAEGTIWVTLNVEEKECCSLLQACGFEEREGESKTNRSKRLKLCLRDNTVRVALFQCSVAQSFAKLIFGVDLVGKKNLTEGLLGEVSWCFFSVEFCKSGSLHFHILAKIKRLDGEFFLKLQESDDCKRVFQRMVNGLSCSSDHSDSIGETLLRPWDNSAANLRLVTVKNVELLAAKSVSHKGIHKHSAYCTKYGERDPVMNMLILRCNFPRMLVGPKHGVWVTFEGRHFHMAHRGNFFTVPHMDLLYTLLGNSNNYLKLVGGSGSQTRRFINYCLNYSSKVFLVSDDAVKVLGKAIARVHPEAAVQSSNHTIERSRLAYVVFSGLMSIDRIVRKPQVQCMLQLMGKSEFLSDHDFVDLMVNVHKRFLREGSEVENQDDVPEFFLLQTKSWQRKNYCGSLDYAGRGEELSGLHLMRFVRLYESVAMTAMMKEKRRKKEQQGGDPDGEREETVEEEQHGEVEEAEQGGEEEQQEGDSLDLSLSTSDEEFSSSNDGEVSSRNSEGSLISSDSIEDDGGVLAMDVDVEVAADEDLGFVPFHPQHPSTYTRCSRLRKTSVKVCVVIHGGKLKFEDKDCSREDLDCKYLTVCVLFVPWREMADLDALPGHGWKGKWDTYKTEHPEDEGVKEGCFRLNVLRQRKEAILQPSITRQELEKEVKKMPAQSATLPQTLSAITTREEFLSLSLADQEKACEQGIADLTEQEGADDVGDFALLGDCEALVLAEETGLFRTADLSQGVANLEIDVEQLGVNSGLETLAKDCIVDRTSVNFRADGEEPPVLDDLLDEDLCIQRVMEYRNSAGNALSAEQQVACVVIIIHLIRNVLNPQMWQPLLFILAGGGGSGKTETIKYVLRWCQTVGKRARTWFGASTGVAARAWGGDTLDTLVYRQGQNAKREQSALERIVSFFSCFIIDEFSMLGQSHLGRFAALLTKARRTLDRGFEGIAGGFSCVLCGDFFQLPSVKDCACHSKKHTGLRGECQGLHFWNGFAMGLQLTGQFRMLPDWHQLTLRIRTGALTEADVAVLVGRMAVNMTRETMHEFFNSPDTCIFLTRTHASRHPLLRAAVTNWAYKLVPKVRVLNWACADRISGVQSSAPGAATYCKTLNVKMDYVQYFAKGLEIVFVDSYDNLPIVNGTQAILKEIHLKDQDVRALQDGSIQQDARGIFEVLMPKAILVELRNVEHFVVQGLEPMHVIILPHYYEQTVDGKLLKVKRTGFKYIPRNAMTFHKVQGLRVRKECIDMTGGNMSRAEFYTACTRVEKAEDLVFLGPLDEGLLLSASYATDVLEEDEKQVHDRQWRTAEFIDKLLEDREGGAMQDWADAILAQKEVVEAEREQLKQREAEREAELEARRQQLRQSRGGGEENRVLEGPFVDRVEQYFVHAELFFAQKQVLRAHLDDDKATLLQECLELTNLCQSCQTIFFVSGVCDIVIGFGSVEESITLNGQGKLKHLRWYRVFRYVRTCENEACRAETDGQGRRQLLEGVTAYIWNKRGGFRTEEQAREKREQVERDAEEDDVENESSDSTSDSDGGEVSEEEDSGETLAVTFRRRRRDGRGEKRQRRGEVQTPRSVLQRTVPPPPQGWTAEEDEQLLLFGGFDMSWSDAAICMNRMSRKDRSPNAYEVRHRRLIRLRDQAVEPIIFSQDSEEQEAVPMDTDSESE